MQQRIYFDNGSTSFPKAPGVGQAMRDFLEQGAFNINRGGYDGAYSVADQVYETRAALCRLFHFQPQRGVVFAPSVTFALNYISKGYRSALPRPTGRAGWIPTGWRRCCVPRPRP